jgi:hypothetical protein
MKKVFIVVLIIIVLITVVIGGIFIWQYSVLQNNPTNSLPAVNQQATEDWKTYTNKEYGFEFKYPSELEISQIVEDPDSPLQIVLFPREHDLILGVTLTNSLDHCLNDGKIVGDAVIDGIDAKIFHDFIKNYQSERILRTSCFIKNKFTYEIYCNFDARREISDGCIGFDLITSTFKFTK